MDNQTDCQSRRRDVHPLPKILQSKWIMASASTELKEFVTIVTGGNPPGRSITNENGRT